MRVILVLGDCEAKEGVELTKKIVFFAWFLFATASRNEYARYRLANFKQRKQT
ncbi:hypothetical protein [Helicobacter sp. 23-1046]